MITVNLRKFTFTLYNQFKLEIFDEAQFVTEFRFAERDIISRLSEALQLPHKIVCCQETVANNIEDLRILLLKTFLSLPFGLHGTTFGKKTLQKFVIFNYKLDYIYSKFNQLLSPWNQDILQLNKLAKLLWVCWWNILVWHGTIKTLFITVTSEYTASSFKVCLYLMDSLVTFVAPMWVNWMIVPCHTSMGCSRI